MNQEHKEEAFEVIYSIVMKIRIDRQSLMENRMVIVIVKEAAGELSKLFRGIQVLLSLRHRPVAWLTLKPPGVSAIFQNSKPRGF